MSKIYVAGKFEEKDLVRQIQKALVERGHEITHDWTREDAGTRKGLALHSYLRACGIADLMGVQDADAVLMLNHKNGYGLMTELGIALAEGIPVVLMNADVRDTVFFHHPLVYAVDTLAEALDRIDWLMDNDVES